MALARTGLRIAVTLLAWPAFTAAAQTADPREPLGAAAAKHGLTAADVAKIRGAAGQILCPWRKGYYKKANAWLINSGKQILTVLHAFIANEVNDSRLIYHPSNCYFLPAGADQKRKVGIESLLLKSETNYLYLRNQAGRPPNWSRNAIVIVKTEGRRRIGSRLVSRVPTITSSWT